MAIPINTSLDQLLRAERQLEKATTALRVIHLWAAGDDPSRQSRERAMQDISNKALAALSPAHDTVTFMLEGLMKELGQVDSDLNEMLDLIGCGYPEMYAEPRSFRFEQLRSFLQKNQ